MNNTELFDLKQIAKENFEAHHTVLDYAQSLLEIQMNPLVDENNQPIDKETLKQSARELNQISLTIGRASRECTRYARIMKKLK
ncbi:MAG: hypothetical protein FWK04_26275 [Nostoc sp. GBBB01]|nr:hypothetical protein [Nostoc sp. GBBB01]